MRFAYLLFLEKHREILPGRLGDGNASGAHKLAYVIFLKLSEQSLGLFRMTGLLDYHILTRNLENACAVTAYHILYACVIEKLERRHLVERHFLVNNLVVGCSGR